MKRKLAWMALTAALSACAAAHGAGPSPSIAYALPPLPVLDAAQARGRDFATRRCSGCHNVSMDDGPPYEAPAFRNLATRYDQAALEGRFAEVSAHGHNRMPPIGFTPEEAGDLVAYFKSLRGN